MVPFQCLALAVSLAGAPVSAQSLVSGTSSSDVGSLSWEGEETWDLGDGWEAAGAATVAESDPEARTRELSLGVALTFAGGATASLGTNVSEDPGAEVRTVGAELGAEAPLGPATLSLGLTANSHRSDVFQPERKVRRRRRTITFPAVTERLRLWEFHPNATVSLPLFGGRVTPSFYTGRTFFSTDPAAVSERIGELEFAPRAEQVAGHVDGLLSHDGEVSVDVELPAGFALRGAAGAERTAVDGSWSSSRSLELALAMGPLELSAGWDRSQSYGERSESWTGGLQWSFGGPPDEDDCEEDESEG